VEPDLDPTNAPGPEAQIQPAKFWNLKPWWCQPWSIVLTGLALPTISWLWLGRWWITAPLLGAVLLWWWVFLVLVPTAYSQQQGQEP
jgi:hypothetical protein